MSKRDDRSCVRCGFPFGMHRADSYDCPMQDEGLTFKPPRVVGGTP